jgi:hypothetical protein
VDSEGTAALLAEIDHCGATHNSGTDWKCAVHGCTPDTTYGGCAGVNSRTFHVIETAMDWNAALQACKIQFPGGSLASVHTADQQKLAEDACKKANPCDETNAEGGTCTTPHGCWIGLNDNFQERRLAWLAQPRATLAFYTVVGCH